MKSPSKHAPGSRFSRRLRTAILLVSVVSLLLASLGYGLVQYRMYREMLSHHMLALASVAGVNAGAALQRGDIAAVDRVLSPLSVEQHVTAVLVFLPDGTPFGGPSVDTAAQQAIGEEARRWLRRQFDAEPGDSRFRVDHDGVDILYPLRDQDRLQGYLFIEGNHGALGSHLLRMFETLLPLLLAVFVLAWALAKRMQHRISGPLEELTGATRRLADEGEYSIRLEPVNDHEFDELVSSFNNMLDQIERRDAALMRKRDELEARVAERTRDLQQAKDSAEAANKAKSDFLATVSHEIRTPMHGVLGMTELLLGSALHGRQQRLAEKVHLSAENLLGLINNVLDFAKIEAGRLETASEPFDLRQVVEDAIEPLAIQAHLKGLEVVLDLPPDLPSRVTGDELRLRQVLINLVGNAHKFTEQGSIEVRIAPCGVSDGVERFLFKISDSGIGIPVEHLEHLFEPFVQVDPTTTRRHAGSGLGLAITRQLIDLMGGSMRIDSTRKTGTSVHFELPLPVIEPAPASLVIDSLRGRRALVVDAHAAQCGMLCRQLEAWGMRCDHADSSMQAEGMVAAAISDSSPYAIVLLDRNLRDKDVNASRAALIHAGGFSSPAVVVMSAVGLDGPSELSEQAAGDAVLSKPVRQEDLLSSLLAALPSPELQPAATGDIAAGSAEPAARDSFSARVLLAEDNPINQDVAMAMLELLGCQVVLAENGRDAVQAVLTASPDLVLMDCHMPEMDGFQAAGEIRRIESLAGPGQRLPIVAVTADVQLGIEQACADAGMDDYLSKPYTEQKLASKLARWLPARTPPATRIAQASKASEDRQATLAGRQAAAVEDETRYYSSISRLLGRMHLSVNEGDRDALVLAASELATIAAAMGIVEAAEICAAIADDNGTERLSAFADDVEAVARICSTWLGHGAPAGNLRGKDQAAVAALSEARILLIGDDMDFRAALRDTLGQKGFTVDESGFGPAVLHKLAASMPELVLLDADRSAPDRFDMVRSLRETPCCSGTPVLIATMPDDVESAERAFDAGATDFVSRQVSLPLIVHRIRFMLRASRQERSLLEKQLQLDAAQRMAGVGYWRWRPAAGDFYLSPILREMLGVSDLRSVDNLVDLAHPSDRDPLRMQIEDARKQIFGAAIDYRVKGPGDRFLRVQQSIGPGARTSDTDVLVGTVQDVSRQRAAEDEIRRLAYYDGLTGLASRTHLMQHLAERIRKARRRKECFSILFLDLDAFKDVNDTLGHDTGDNLLATISRRLQEVTRESDFVARLGGDEFCIILDEEGLGSATDAAEAASRCLAAIERPVELHHSLMRPNASIGIARYPDDGNSSSALLKAADSAMYAAKQAGKHQYAFYQEAMTEEAEKRLLVEQAVRTALESNQFLLFYQPQVDLKQGRLVGVEALIRSRSPQLEQISPAQLIDVCERIGLIGALGQWVAREACMQLRKWHDLGYDDLRVSINVSPFQFATDDLLRCLDDILQETGLPADHVELEITESTVQANEKAIRLLNDIKSRGMRIAIDDFGTGYSSLGSLRHLPVDTLKIDRTFIVDIANRPEDSILLGTITGLCHALEFDVVAEGVEDLEQVQILAGLGCDIVQGYYFSRPRPAEEILALLERHKENPLYPSKASGTDIA